MGEEGFSLRLVAALPPGDPVGDRGARPWDLPDLATVANHPLRPRHLQLHDLFPAALEGADAVTGRRLVLGNADVRICPMWSPARRRRCTATGWATSACTSSPARPRWRPCSARWTSRAGDYIVIPRATTHRWIPTGAEPLAAYAIEANSHITPPKRYLSRFGQLLEHAPYCERDLRGPTEPLLLDGRRRRGLRQAPRRRAGRDRRHRVHLPDPPVRRGRLGRLPLPVRVQRRRLRADHRAGPPAAAGRTRCSRAANFVVCNFVPRKVDYHPLAIPVPYYHSNVDSDEVMFYVGGDYEARKGSGIGLGSISLHPGGYAHGPQPGAASAASGAEFFDELAVMVDTFRPLELGEGGARLRGPGVRLDLGRRPRS